MYKAASIPGQLFYFSGKYGNLFQTGCFRSVIFREDLFYFSNSPQKIQSVPFLFHFP
jgi:hypothetical protein